MVVGLAMVVFWVCLGLVVYVYAAYPVLIFVLGRLFGQKPVPPAEPAREAWPRISLLLAAYNEEAVLADRLDNALAMDYPADRLEIVVGSDGSSDGTADVVNRYSARGIRLIDYRERQGKASVLNRSVPTLTGDIVLLSDANTTIEPDAARNLVRWFARPEVSCVCGRLVIVDPTSGKNADGLYWKYETLIKRSEARLGALLGANGAIYAIRRDAYVSIPDGTIIDDFAIPLLSIMRRGGSLVYDPSAVAIEESAPDVSDEFRRRCRIGAGGYQCLSFLWPLLHPRHGWRALAFLSHKILRWLCPFFLIGALAANVGLAVLGSQFWFWVLVAQLGFYTVSLLAPAHPGRWLRPFRLATMFTSMNLALMVGFGRWFWGSRSGTWAPTRRVVSRQETLG